MDKNLQLILLFVFNSIFDKLISGSAVKKMAFHIS